MLRRLLILICCFSFSSLISAQTKTEQLGRLSSKPGVPSSVTLNVTVTDASGVTVTGLDKSAFNILDNKVPQEITSFTNEDVPVSIGVIFDMSDSMISGRGALALDAARNAFLQFTKKSHKENLYFVMGFTRAPQLLTDWTRNSDAIVDGLNKLPSLQTKAAKTTALYDACYEGIEKVLTGTHPKRAIILITDGEDNGSLRGFEQLQDRLKKENVLLYALVIYDNFIMPGSSVTMGPAGPDRLLELARLTGGAAAFFNPFNSVNRALPIDTDPIYQDLDHIAAELRSQYSIVYTPSGFRGDANWHRVQVTTKLPRNSQEKAPRSAKP